MQSYLKDCRLFMMGDFSLANWLQRDSACSDALLDNLTRFVHLPTRIHGLTSTVLDLTFISDHLPECEVQVDVIEGVSEHKMTVCFISVLDTLRHLSSHSTFLSIMRIMRVYYLIIPRNSLLLPIIPRAKLSA